MMKPTPVDISRANHVAHQRRDVESLRNRSSVMTPQRAKHENQVRETVSGMQRIQHINAYILVEEVSSIIFDSSSYLT